MLGIIIGVVVGVVVILLVCVLAWWISTHNDFKRSLVKIEEAKSSIDIALNKRYDTLTKMIDITKGYAKHEKETLIEVTKMRTGVPQNANMEQLQEVSNNLQALAKQLDVVVERYPELKADTSFVELQRASRDVEENLQAARRMYNSNVSYYNQKREVFPSSIVANHYHLEKALFFEVEEIKRSDVKMDF